jgi:hypothetical protein
LEYYRKSDGVTKKKILNTIFAEKLILEKGEIVSPAFTEPIQLILRISKVLRKSENKKEVDLNQSLVATLTKNPIFQFKNCNHDYLLIGLSQSLIWWGFQDVIKRNKRSILTSCASGYPEWDLNPHSIATTGV